jgi:hypothetical protein
MSIPGSPSNGLDRYVNCRRSRESMEKRQCNFTVGTRAVNNLACAFNGMNISVVPNPKGWQRVAGGRFGLLAKRPPVTGRISVRTPAGVPETGCFNHVL